MALAIFALRPTEAAAQQPVEAERALATFSPAEVRAIEPLLTNGIVSLVEHSNDGQPAVVMACEIAAPPDVVADVIGDPAAYPSFMPALGTVEVTSREGDQISYGWTWGTSIFTLSGTNVLQRFSPPPGREAAGHRFVVRQTGGDLGSGRTVWRVLPRPNGHSLVMTSSRLDLRDANYIARQLAAGGSVVSRSVNIALSFSMLLRTRGRAEERVDFHRPALAAATGEPARPPIDLLAVERIFDRGDLLWVETTYGEDQGRIVAIGKVGFDEARTRTAILDPGGFTNGLLSGAHANILEATAQGTRFEWGIDLPLVGTSGQMRMYETPDRLVRLDGTGGALDDARWRFETVPRDASTIVLTWGHFDLADGLWLIRVVTESDASMRPGLSAAAELMMIRGLRSRLIRGL